MNKNRSVEVQGHLIRVSPADDQDYISLTDIAKYRDEARTDYLIQNWLRNRSTIEFLGVWEQLYNPDFNPIEFDGIRTSAGLNSFVLTTKRWIEATGAIGIVSKTGRYGGTYAHRDIAFEFASWISVEFRLYLIKEFQRLQEQEQEQNQLDWSVRRSITKFNYRLQTDAIKDHLIPPVVGTPEEKYVYANEADVLNVALFGKTAKQWRDQNPGTAGNIRDYASTAQLVCLSNLETLNTLWIREGLSREERLGKLNQIARDQMTALLADDRVHALEAKN